MTAISAVLFDYGMVLSGPAHPPAWERMRTILGVSEEALQRGYWEPRVDYDRGTLSGAAYWRRVAEIAGTSLADGALQALFDADTELWTQPNEAMIAWAAALQRAGVTTGILSNLGDAMEAGVRARCGWLEDFDHLTFSHTLLMVKPDRAIYEHAAQGLGLPPEQILFVDDREENVDGARVAGMRAIQYGTHAQFVAEMEAAGLGYLLHPAGSTAEPQ